MSFYKELTTKYKASGDFAMAYVIAHEVGHHVQNELGILGKYHRMQQGLSEKERNAISVRIELQADYLAGVWARSIQDRNLLDIGDIEEAMNAAHAVGMTLSKSKPTATRYQIALPTELPSNACAGSNEATSTGISNTAIPLACQIVNFKQRSIQKSF